MAAWTRESTDPSRRRLEPLSTELTSPGARTRLDVVRLALVCATLVACASAYSAHLTSFLHAKEYALAIGVAALGMLTLINGRTSRVGVSFLIPLLMLALVAVSAGLAGFSTLNRATAIELLRWSVLALFVLNVFDLLETEQGRRVVCAGIVASTVAVSVLALAQFAGLVPVLFPLYEGHAHPLYSVFGNPGLMGGYVALGLPLAFHFACGRTAMRPIWIASLFPICAGLAISGTRSAWAAALAGVLFVLAYERLWNRYAAASLLVVLMAVAAIVLVAPDQTIGRFESAALGGDPSSSLRFWFWSGAIELIREHPIFGVGPGNFAYYSPDALAQVLHAPGGDQFAHNEIHTLHVHSDYLELAAELGVIGLALMLWWCVRLLRCPGPEWGSLIACAVFATFYFPSFSTPHALVTLTSASILFARRNSADAKPAGRAVATLVGLSSLAVLGLVVWMVLIPSFAFRQAQDQHLGNSDPIPAYERLAEHPWAPADVHEKLGLALLQAGDNAAAEREFMNALATLDTGAVYLGLGVARFQQGKMDEAREAFESCVYRWPSHAYAWELLLRVTPQEDRDKVLERASTWLGREDIERLEKVG